MRIFITGICGFVGSWLAQAIKDTPKTQVFGIDNLFRPGSEINRGILLSKGIGVFHGDVRLWADLENLPPSDWVIDAAANPSVLAGIDGLSTSRQLVENNLIGTLNVLEYCKRHKAGFILLSTSRVYSLASLAVLPIRIAGNSFALDLAKPLPPGLSEAGIGEDFSVAAPVSLYGSTKLASEIMALEYGATFGFPVWVNRCGVLAGAGQFATADQGIFSYWMHAHAARRPLRYIGFGGFGYQVRDALHPADLAQLLMLQMVAAPTGGDRVYNAGGGAKNSMSLAQLTAVCNDIFGDHVPIADCGDRPFDLPWIVMNSGKIRHQFGWEPTRTITSILHEIAQHVRDHPGWLDLCATSANER